MYKDWLRGFGLALCLTQTASLHAQVGGFPSAVTGSWDNPEAFQYRPPVNKTSSIQGPVPSNRWWSALLVRDEVKLMSAYPVFYGAAVNEYPAEGEGFGISVGYRGIGKPIPRSEEGSEVPANRVRTVDSDVQSQFLVWNGSMDRGSTKTRLHGYGDWHVVTETSDNAGRRFYTTMAAGSPYSSFEFVSGQPRIRLNSFGGQIEITDGAGHHVLGSGQSYNSDRILVKVIHPVSQEASYWGFYSAAGTQWYRQGEYLNVTIGSGANYLNTALLPRPDLFDEFYRHAYARITGTKASYSYDEAKAEIVTRFEFQTASQRGGFSSEVLSALFPHQYKHLREGWADAGKAYPSMRGSLRVWRGNSFTTALRNEGILQTFNEPKDSPGYSIDDHRQWTQWEDYVKWAWGVDTYGTGKALQRAALSLSMTDALEMPWLRDEIIAGLYKEFGEWFNPDLTSKPLFWADNLPYKFFSEYKASEGHWGHITGWRASYGTQALNDMHLHAGYWIYAASILAAYHPTFVKDYGWAIEKLIGNVASPYRGGKDFPYIRVFDPYAGRSYASGYYWFGYYNGNDLESTSEALNTWQSIFQWGQITGQKQYRDLGLYLYWTERSAAEQYWFDVDSDVHHPSYAFPLASVVREGSYDFATHWGSKQIEEIYGIQLLPLTPATLHLALNRPYMKKIWDAMSSTNQAARGTNFETWHGTMLSFQALVEPTKAVERYKFGEIAGPPGGEYSPIQDHETWSLVYHFIHSLNQLGLPLRGYWADQPGYGVFEKGGKVTFIAFNPSASENLTVNFYDGNGQKVHSIADIPPHKTVYSVKN